MNFSEIKTPEDVRAFMENISKQMMEGFRREQLQKGENYKTLNKVAVKGQILFTGSSLMEQFPVCELAQTIKLDKKVYNRGIGGTTTEDFIREIDTVLLDLEPSKVFINIGTNDMSKEPYGDRWMEQLLKNYGKILKILKERLPYTEVFLMAYYPVNDAYVNENPTAASMLEVRTMDNINKINGEIEKLTGDFGYQYINVNEGLLGADGKLKLEYTIEGVHMYAAAYEVVFENLKKYL